MQEQKITKNLPPGHHCTTLSGYIFATKACIDNRKKPVKQQYLLHMSSQYGELRRTSGWDRFVSLGHPSKFQWVSHFGFVTAAMSLNGSQPNFARYLAVSWAGTLYIHIYGGFFPCKVILPGATFTLRPSLAPSYFGSVTANHILHALLPPSSTTSQNYGLRQRVHSLQLPECSTHLNDCNFLVHMLYNNSY